MSCSYIYYPLFAIFILLMIIILLKESKWWKALYKDYKENSVKFSPIINNLVWTGVILIFFSFLAPFIFTREDSKGLFEFSDKTGYVGDTIGGIMNPFIALAAVIVTGLAFYMQYQANQQIREQFKLQQFESQFYEMLRLHKSNVDEIELTIYSETKIPIMNSHYEEIDFTDPRIVKGRKVFMYYIQEVHLLLDCVSECDLMNIKQSSFRAAYDMFFLGKEKFYDIDDLHFSTLRNVADSKVDEIKTIGLEDNHHLHTYFNLFEGHVDYLGHYYRHLYMTVKFVIESYEKESILTSEKECLKYLKILRGQLSNAEQILLFYNWIAGGEHGYGAKWEIGDKRKYFSKYLMLHNLNFRMLFKGQDNFIRKKVKEIYERSENSSKLFELNLDAIDYMERYDNELMDDN